MVALKSVISSIELDKYTIEGIHVTEEDPISLEDNAKIIRSPGNPGTSVDQPLAVFVEASADARQQAESRSIIRSPHDTTKAVSAQKPLGWRTGKVKRAG